MSDRHTGVVRWFNNKKGYVFIDSEVASGEDIFVHFRDIQGEGYRSLNDGQKVSFSMNTTQKGLHAEEVEKVE